MIWAFLTSRFLGLAKGWWLLIAVGLLVGSVVGFNLWLAGERAEAVAADRRASRAEAVSRAREADESAHATAAGKSDAVRASNEAAARAADESDDPLKVGLDALREQQR